MNFSKLLEINLSLQVINFIIFIYILLAESNTTLSKIINEILNTPDLIKSDDGLIKQIIISIFGLKSDLKSKLTQFINEELTSIFDYEDKGIKLYSFLKLALWYQPILLFAPININTINILFCLASNLKVGCEFVEIVDSNLISIITKAIEEGSWIVISGKNKLNNDMWKKTCSLLKKLGNDDKITDNFRFFVDCQEMTYDELPAELIKNEGIIFNLGMEDIENMEVFSDIKANKLNANALDIIKKEIKAKLTFMEKDNKFTSLMLLKEEGSIETQLDTIGLFEGKNKINIDANNFRTILDLFYPRKDLISRDNINKVNENELSKDNISVTTEDEET